MTTFRLADGREVMFMMLSTEKPDELKEIIRQAKMAAKSGRKDAFYLLGQLYENGKGVPQNMNEAIKLYKRGYELGDADCAGAIGCIEMQSPFPDFAKAKRLFEWAVERGSVEALNYMGMLYHYGNGVPRDEYKSYQYHYQAVQKGSTFGAFNLGNKLRDGLGCEQNYSEAVKYMKIAADAGDPQAKNNLAIFYDNGWGVPVDHKEAFRLYSLAAESGLEQCIYNIATKYRDGEGVERDINKAIQMFIRAGDQGFAKAYMEAGKILLNGREIAPNPREAARVLRLGAQLGDAECAYFLGTCLYAGNGCRRDTKEAFKWFQFSLERGFRLSYSKVGLMYDLGEGVPVDHKKAVLTYKKGADAGCRTCAMQLGAKYSSGEGVKQDMDMACHYYRLAAKEHPEVWSDLISIYIHKEQRPEQMLEVYRQGAVDGHPQTTLEYARMLHDGIGCQPNPAEAVRWYRTALNYDLSEAYYRLAMAYDVGDGVDRDEDECIRLLQKACELEDRLAPLTLALKLCKRPGFDREEVKRILVLALMYYDKRIKYLLRYDNPETEVIRGLLQEVLRESPFPIASSSDDEENDFDDDQLLSGPTPIHSSNQHPQCQTHQFDTMFDLVLETLPLTP